MYARPVHEIAGYDCANAECVTLEETIRNEKTTILIGTSGTAGLFSEPVIRALAASSDRPVVFPLSNPTS
jgi:malate dehydrogenase (oxaloacetate-decarboxylating)